jgi:hypothetical protein
MIESEVLIGFLTMISSNLKKIAQKTLILADFWSDSGSEKPASESGNTVFNATPDFGLLNQNNQSYIKRYMVPIQKSWDGHKFLGLQLRPKKYISYFGLY